MEIQHVREEHLVKESYRQLNDLIKKNHHIFSLFFVPFFPITTDTVIWDVFVSKLTEIDLYRMYHL